MAFDWKPALGEMCRHAGASVILRCRPLFVPAGSSVTSPGRCPATRLRRLQGGGDALKLAVTITSILPRKRRPFRIPDDFAHVPVDTGGMGVSRMLPFDGHAGKTGSAQSTFPDSRIAQTVQYLCACRVRRFFLGYSRNFAERSRAGATEPRASRRAHDARRNASSAAAAGRSERAVVRPKPAPVTPASAVTSPVPADQNRWIRCGLNSPMPVNAIAMPPSPMAPQISAVMLVMMAADASTMAICSAAEATS